MSGARGWLRLIPIAVLVTAVLAGLTMWLRADGIEANLAGRARAALDAAGIRDGDVQFSGRQATLAGFPAEQAGRALGIVQGVEGVESAQSSGGTGPVAPAPSTSVPPISTPPSTTPSPSSTPSAPPTDRGGLQDELDRRLADAPITFEPDSAKLTDAGEKAARDIAPLLKDAPDSLRYRVTGHIADGPGGRSAGRILSRNRALTVVRLLTREDVPVGRLLAVGSSTPGNSGSGDDDRRVEITVEQR